MGRKRKQVDPGVASNLPPCRVCGAPGSGLHYGVNTCEACKGFFHRSLKIWTQYKCDMTGQCPVEPGRSKLCHLCRYNRCLAVGMAKEAIKTGRYTSTKRTKDILEIRQLQEKQTLSAVSLDRHISEHLSPTGTFSTIDNEQSFSSVSQTGMFTPVSRNTSGQFSLESMLKFNPELSEPLIHHDQLRLKETPSLREGRFVEANTDKIPHDCATNNQIQKTHLDSSPGHGLESLLSLEEDTELLQGQQLQQQLLSSSSLTPLSMTSPEEITSLPILEEEVSMPLIACSSIASVSLSSNTSPSSTGQLSGNMLEGTASMSISLCSPRSHESLSDAYGMYTTTLLQSPSRTSTTSPKLATMSPVCLAVAPSVAPSATSSLLQIDPQDSEFVIAIDSCSTDWSIDSVSKIYKDKDLIIRTLIAADESSLIPVFGQMTDEEILQQQLEHLEACRLKREMFGPLTKLPDHEYDYIFVTTGLDTDDRQKLLNDMGECLEKMIRAMVKFCKAIPDSRQEFYIFITYKCVDYEKKILRGFDLQWKCENELLKLPSAADARIHAETLDGYLKFCQSLRSLNLSYNELVVIRALIAMAPDRDKPVNSALAREIHWQLTLCLIHLLSQRYPNPFSVFARIMDRLTEARTQTEGVIYFLKKMKMDKYSHVMYNPLLKEMFGGIFFNNDEDDWGENV
ncbi:unnamed protein product [Candidula unifasciata]|uniref:Nuclear receptor domain-containing protein n=1 Tax=Candidula unifasciata TaxID=100452 RepID=A0A8S3YMM4_9EUPU|nr:unnamed protein product [Candidula unifasciata]